MGQREATAIALLPLVLAGIVWLPPWVYLAAVAIVTLLACWELLELLRLTRRRAVAVAIGVALVVTLPVLWHVGLTAAGPALAAIVLALPLVVLLTGHPTEGAAATITGAVFAAVFFTVTGGAMGYLRLALGDAVGWKVVLLHCLTIWAGDSGAYYLGSRFGRHRLAPVVSPKKSWEGVAGGTAATFFAVWVCRTLFFAELPLAAAVSLAILLSILAPLGDLVESLLKRDAGVKDSSALIPGHGGFLDRTDSLFFAAPFTLALLLGFGLAA
ncbi:MAG: phosphatidate cytidylyltransferase [Acidobacteriota bacterium]|jgi:phosphatidate cytidylyltransferase